MEGNLLMDPQNTQTGTESVKTEPVKTEPVKVEAPKKVTAILYLDRSNFMYFDTTTGASAAYQYPSEVILDLEVINEELLQQQISSLVQQNNLTPTQLIIFLAPGLLFEKKLPLPPPGQKDTDEIQKFIDTVPFEVVSFTKFTVVDGVQVIAANSNFFISLKQCFEKQGFIVTQVIPVTVVGEDVTNGINLDMAVRFLGKADNWKQYNILQSSKEVILPTDKKLEMVPHEKKSQNRVFVLGGVFIILVGILVVMILLQR